ncbi:MAG: serine/threonine-protein kinase [Planctomycetota bacterium]|nr:serine/threonine protein kinase [Planctomycetota bacterium]MCX8040049.1 serine/threonine protein kinase [Planctomycetota bacterium]MDW8373843.1 serine/threonine-protein kinase [Planctomycetota bacterium]
MTSAPTWLEALAADRIGDLPPSQTFRSLVPDEPEATPSGERSTAAAEAAPAPARSEAATEELGPAATAATVEVPVRGRLRFADVIDTDFDRAGRPYILVGTLGEGGMGIVHLARQRTTGREVAIKTLRAEFIGTPRQAAFHAECTVTAALEHPNIPPVYDAGDDFLVMRRLRGHCFESMLAGRGLDALGFAIEVLIKVCDAVSYAHSQGVIHRDIKGDNILVGPFGQVWLMDWGLAAGIKAGPDRRWHAPRVRTIRELCAGTPMCLPPEVATGDIARLSFAADLFMLGALLYRILCGSYPFESPNTRRSVELAARNAKAPLLTRAPGAPFRLIHAAEQALAWDPDDRGTVEGFANELRTWLHTSGASEQASVLLERAQRALRDGEMSAKPADAYQHFATAIGCCERALGLCAEQRLAHELLKRAREGFVRAAVALGEPSSAPR